MRGTKEKIPTHARTCWHVRGILGNKVLMLRRHDCDDTVNHPCRTIHLDFVVQVEASWLSREQGHGEMVREVRTAGGWDRGCFVNSFHHSERRRHV